MTFLIKGENNDWEVVIGLEVHAQVISESKLFSGASVNFGADPNTQVSYVDAGMPGMLPVVNDKCVEQAIRTGLGLKAKINMKSIFARKNYFYADLPQGYQISQFELPIVGEGVIELDLPDGHTRVVGIERLHLEQDAGKSIHDLHPEKSFIDLNRSGIALMEIVSKPDMRSSEEVGAYLRKLRSILRYLNTCDGNMDEGSMRCDANVSVRPVGSDELRTRCEIKNVNSVKFVMQAIEYEAKRQVDVYDNNGEVFQETRLFDQSKGETRPMRSKEFAHDYRYFPDPDLLPLELDQSYIDKIKKTLPELPDEKKSRFINEYKLDEYDSSVLVSDSAIADYFEIVANGRDSKISANWVMTNLFSVLNKKSLSIQDSPVSAENLGILIDLIGNKIISGRIAKDVFEIMVEEKTSPADIVEEKGLKQITNTDSIEAAVDEVISENPDKVGEYKGGKTKLIGWFVGQVMKKTKGKANPGIVNEILSKKL